MFCSICQQSLSESAYVCFLLQVYSPNYVLPPTKCCSDEMGMDLRYLLIPCFIVWWNCGNHLCSVNWRMLSYMFWSNGCLFVTRQSWVGRIDPHDSHFLAIAIAEQQLLNAEFDDCMTSNSSGATCCRSIALIVWYTKPSLSKPIFIIVLKGE